MHSRLIARELRTRGFDAIMNYSNGKYGVIVSLKRQISTQEVKDALSLSFEEIEFNVSKISINQVLVQE